MRTCILNKKTETPLCSDEYAAKWGLTDFYPEAEAKLRDLISSGEDFRTSYECYKELRSATIDRGDGEVTISVTCFMDSYDDNELINDAVWVRLGDNVDLPNGWYDAVYDAAMDENLYDRSSGSVSLPIDASFEDVTLAIEHLEFDCEEENTRMFNLLCNIVEHYAQHIDLYKEED